MLKKMIVALLAAGLLNLISVPEMQGQSEPNLSGLERLPHPFDFDGPFYPNPSIVFEGNLPDFPETMMIYKVIHPNVTEASVRELAHKFGMSEDAELKRSRALRLYWLKTSEQALEVDPSDSSFNIRKLKREDLETAAGKTYPSESDCRKIAEQYLGIRNLLSEDAYFRGVADNTKYSAGVMSVGFGRKINGYKTWGAGGEILIEIGSDEEIVQIRKSWQQLIPYKSYPIKSPQEALEELRNAKGLLMHGCEGEVKNITIRYYTSPQKQDYVQPVYYFDCVDLKGDSFYGVIPAVKQGYLKPKGGLQESSVQLPAEQPQPVQVEPVDVNELLGWLEELRQNDEFNEIMTEQQWQEFIEAVKEHAESRD